MFSSILCEYLVASCSFVVLSLRKSGSCAFKLRTVGVINLKTKDDSGGISNEKSRTTSVDKAETIAMKDQVNAFAVLNAVAVRNT